MLRRGKWKLFFHHETPLAFKTHFMGLSFHYSGRIAQLQQLNNLITEVEDIVKVFNWKYHIYERQFPENKFGEIDYNDKIYGISS